VKLISAIEVVNSSVDHELPYFETLLKQTSARYSRVDLVSADSVYLSCGNCDLVAGVGGVSRFCPKKGCSLRQKGSRVWCLMFEELIVDS
jgi:hypothetical protein